MGRMFPDNQFLPREKTYAYIHTYLQNINKMYEMYEAAHLDHHSPIYIKTGGDEEITGNYLKKSSTEAWRHKDLSSFRVASQQTSILIIPCLIVAARCSF
jgi:hypothetical protein